MTREAIVAKLTELAIVPAVRTATAEQALRAAHALAAAGVTNLELPVTVPGALDVIRQLRSEHPHDWLVGAGTVLDAATARAAILAGAQFIVCPSLHLDVIQMCRRYSVPVIPGALTPTEIVTAWEAGADIIKVFPASAMGGASYIKALAGPLPQVRLMPMGGVNLETAAAYLAAGSCALGVGADLISVKWLAAHEDHKVTEKAAQYLACVRESRAAKA